jgi:glycosyltransferase involved in cell wall biosynthesis
VRILFANPGGDATGGAERSLCLLIRGLTDRGHTIGAVTLAAGTAAEAFAQAGADILADGLGQRVRHVQRHGSSARLLYGIATSAPSAATTASRLRSHAASFDAAILHTNGLQTHVLTPFLLGPHRAVVWSLRDLPPTTPALMLLRSTARFAAAITAPSVWASDLARRCRKPVYVIPNPVCAAEGVDPEQARYALGLPSGRRVVTVLAHLHPTKGQHVAIEAWAALPAPRPLLVLAGGDLYGAASARYRQHLEAMVEQARLTADVMLVGLIRDPAQLYAATDLVLHPALHPEGFGRSMAEAQLSAVPVIATALGAACELIEDGKSGILVPPNSPADIAAAVQRLLGSPSLYDRLREGGMATRSRYLPERHAAAMESVYRAVEP